MLVGDESLSTRPMRRVVEPAARRWVRRVDGRDDGELAPITVRGGALHGVRHELATASGQVKTALVLAGLQAAGTTEIVEPAPSRDHTERMLAALGVPLDPVDDRTVRVTAGEPHAVRARRARRPVVGRVLRRGRVRSSPARTSCSNGVSLNPARVAYLDILREMGATIEVDVTGDEIGEPVGDIHVDCRAAARHRHRR